jgi:hypothetical protein
MALDGGGHAQHEEVVLEKVGSGDPLYRVIVMVALEVDTIVVLA